MLQKVAYRYKMYYIRTERRSHMAAIDTKPVRLTKKGAAEYDRLFKTYSLKKRSPEFVEELCEVYEKVKKQS